MADHRSASDADRYSRQVRFAAIGPAGQSRLAAATATMVGVGALGSVISEQLARAGVGRLRLIDGDIVEWSNLQRQGLYTEADANAGAAKAIAAARHLTAINAGIVVEPVVAWATASRLPDLLAGSDVVLDGTDNFATRHLINEWCCRGDGRGGGRVPWVYAACVGASAVGATIVPGVTPCLRCWQDDLPAAGDGPACDSVGIIAPAVHAAAASAVAEALKILIGADAAIRRGLWSHDLWTNEHRTVGRRFAPQADCPACSPRATWPLLAAGDPGLVVLCGRDAVQIQGRAAADLTALAGQLGPRALVANDIFVRWRDGDLTLTTFRDGRVLVQGTMDAATAQRAAARMLG